MDDPEIRAAKRRVAWLMVPVVLVALVAAAIMFIAVWGFTHPDTWGP
jgi:hypothetical protein